MTTEPDLEKVLNGEIDFIQRAVIKLRGDDPDMYKDDMEEQLSAALDQELSLADDEPIPQFLIHPRKPVREPVHPVDVFRGIMTWLNYLGIAVLFFALGRISTSFF